jgi:disulfide bond formation protein DsbB
MNPLHWSFRTAFGFAALVVAALLGYAYYAQFELGLEPCPLCIFQRIAMIALFIVLLAAALHAPRGRGRRVYGALAALAALSGVAIAGRHVWLQHLPPDQVPACGPGLDYLLDTFPLGETLRKVFTGSGECAEVHWRFAGLSMPEWTLVFFVLLLAGALYYGFRRYRS